MGQGEVSDCTRCRDSQVSCRCKYIKMRVVCLFSFLCCVAFLFFVYLRFVSSALNVVSVSGLLMLSVSLDC
jgi:uncharacterized membrane protein